MFDRSPHPRAARVLVIDDEPIIRSVLMRFLRPRCAVETAADAAEGIAIVAAVPDLALVLCDVRMPRGDGFEVLRTVAQDHPHLVARFAFMTGGAGSAEAEARLARTGVPLLRKPFDSMALLRFIEPYLTAASLPDPAATISCNTAPDGHSLGHDGPDLAP